MLLAAVSLAITAAASLPSSAFASGTYRNGNVEISDNDDVTQSNVQLSDQRATIDHSDNKVKCVGSSVTNAIGQSSSQNALNIFKDNDKIKLPKGYSGSISVTDNDNVTQTNVQLSDQAASIESNNKLCGNNNDGDGGGGSVDKTIVQSSDQNALNAFFDNDKIHVQKGYVGNIKVCDDDTVDQTNVQSSNQTATIDSDNKIKGKDGSVTNAIGQATNQNALNIFKDNDKIMVKKSYIGDVLVCDNDIVKQTNAQLSDQTATIGSDNKLKKGNSNNDSSVSNLIGQSSEQNGANVLSDNDFFKFK